jgi:hypothetical protein
MTACLWLGVAGVVCGLPLCILMDWIRDRPGWPAEDSILRWELWMLSGLATACLGILSLGVRLLALWLL